MPSASSVYQDTQANILALTASQVSKGSLLFATDTSTFFVSDGVSIKSLAAYEYAVNGSSAGLTVTGNLNPTFTPAKNALMEVTGFMNITTYTSGSLGFAVNYSRATSGTLASATENLPLVKGVGAGWGGKNLAASTAGNATGSWKVIAATFEASGGKAVQPLTNGNFAGKYTVYWQISQLS